jgi:hypothetical protein
MGTNHILATVRDFFFGLLCHEKSQSARIADINRSFDSHCADNAYGRNEDNHKMVRPVLYEGWFARIKYEREYI